MQANSCQITHRRHSAYRLAVRARKASRTLQRLPCSTGITESACFIDSHERVHTGRNILDATLAPTKRRGRGLVDLPAGFAGGNHSFGGICTLQSDSIRSDVKICNDDMIGHFSMQKINARTTSEKTGSTSPIRSASAAKPYPFHTINRHAEIIMSAMPPRIHCTPRLSGLNVGTTALMRARMAGRSGRNVSNHHREGILTGRSSQLTLHLSGRSRCSLERFVLLASAFVARRVVIPGLVRRRLLARQTLRLRPEMSASRATACCPECVPYRPATGTWLAGCAIPATISAWLPTAQRAVDMRLRLHESLLPLVDGQIMIAGPTKPRNGCMTPALARTESCLDAGRSARAR